MISVISSNSELKNVLQSTNKLPKAVKVVLISTMEKEFKHPVLESVKVLKCP